MLSPIFRIAAAMAARVVPLCVTPQQTASLGLLQAPPNLSLNLPNVVPVSRCYDSQKDSVSMINKSKSQSYVLGLNILCHRIDELKPDPRPERAVCQRPKMQKGR
jgi:hypothetical protein